MPKYKVRVEVMAAVEYTVEVEAATEREANDQATAKWRDKVPDDFRVAKGYITHCYADRTDQLTATCERCDVEYPLLDWLKHPDAIQPWIEDQDYCAPCGALILEEEKVGK